MAERRANARYLAMLLPAAVILCGVFTYPLLDTLWLSFTTPHGVGLANYERLLRDPTYFKVFEITFEVAAWTTLLTLALGYPVAYVLASLPRRAAAPLMLLLLAPFFTSVLVRTYAWLVILGRHGLLNEALAALHLGPLALIYNRTGVLIGMTSTLIPFMVFALYGNMRAIDRRLVKAAQGLGANGWQAFRTIFWPLSLPGVAGGVLLVFILALGYFVTPRLMGGPRDMMVGMLIQQEIDPANEYGVAAALATILLVVTVAGFLAYKRVVGLRALLESRP